MIVVYALAVVGLLTLTVILWALGSVLIGSLVDARKARRRMPAAPPEPVDAIADLLETKAGIRRDELRRWADAWARAAGLPDFGSAVREIREIEYVAVRDDRQRRLAAEQAQRLLQIEERQAERTARLEAERAALVEAAAAAEAHQAHLAARRARYAQRRNG